MGAKLDEVGYWSELKLEILQKYAVAYSTILSQKNLRYYYIDGFAGPGEHKSKTSGEVIPGSPVIALNVKPPFHGYYFVDLKPKKTDHLSHLIGDRPNVKIFTGDCNQVLLENVLPQVQYKDFQRALCLLDPYGLHLKWEVIQTAGQSKAVEIFLNFPVMDMNMNVLWEYLDKINPDQKARMDSFWGDDSWRQAAYSQSSGLFGPMDDKKSMNAVVSAFKKRLKEVAGFKFVPDPLHMRNNKRAIVYYLFFASPNETGAKIVKDIFDKYKDREA
jgi:three-Cys-motif partner protein